VVRTSTPVTAINATVQAIHLRIVISGLIVTGLLVAVSVWLSLRISLPLREIKARAERFVHGGFDRRLPTSGFEEISALAEGMNRMAEQLDERIRTIQRQQNELEAVLGSMEEGVLAVDKGPGKNKLGNLIEPKEAQRPWVMRVFCETITTRANEKARALRFLAFSCLPNLFFPGP